MAVLKIYTQELKVYQEPEKPLYILRAEVRSLASRIVDLQARQKMQDTGESYSEAVKAVLAEDEELKKQYIFGGN